MKHLLLSILTIFSLNASAQSFFVVCDDQKSKETIEAAIKDNGYEVATTEPSSDYQVRCEVWQTSKINSMYKGNLKISHKGAVVAKSSDVRRGAVAVNGFNASSNIYEVIARKELADLLKKATNN